MSFVERERGAARCRTLLLAGDASPPELATAIARCLADAESRGPIDVFADRPAGPFDATVAHRLRWHRAATDVRAALRMIAETFNSDSEIEVAYLSARITVAPGWQGILRQTLRADPRIGTACPLCAQDALHSPFESVRSSQDVAGLAEWLDSHADPRPIELPAPLSHCGVLSARARRALMPNATDVAPLSHWGRDVARSGLVHVVCARVLASAAGDLKTCDTVDADNTLLARRALWIGAHPLTALRAHVMQAQAQWRRRHPPNGGPADQSKSASALSDDSCSRMPRPSVRLHIAHSWGGGLGSWVRDFCAADGNNEHFVLRSIGVVGAYGQRLALYRGGESVEPIRIWELQVPIDSTAIAHLQYAAVLREIVAEFTVDAVLVSSLIGHSLDTLQTGLPTLLITHDHTPFCIAIFAYFDGECRQCDGTRLRSCVAHNEGHRFFRNADVDDWMALRRAFCNAVIDNDVLLVAPSPSVGARWRDLMPGLAQARWFAVPHGIALPEAVDFTPPAQGKLRLIKLGRLSAEKGGALLEEMIPLVGPFAELILLGCGGDAARLNRLPGVTAVDSFAREDLPRLIAQARPHLGLELSVVPETFSYTLSELWHCGVPVLAARVGSLADRVRDGENGFLVEPSVTAMVARLREIAQQPEVLIPIRSRLRAQSQRDCAAMVADYQALLPGAGSNRRTAARGAAMRPDIATGRVTLGPLSIDPQVAYRQVVRAFLRYSIRKAAHSPRVPQAVRRLLFGYLG